MTRAEMIYDYPLFSFSRFVKFFRYSWKASRELHVGNRIAVFTDMIWCAIRYGAQDTHDYKIFEFWKKSARERNKFVTMRRHFKMIKRFDRDTFMRLCEDKTLMYADYGKFIRRKWLLVNSKTDEGRIREFVREQGRVVVKPLSSEQGRGIYMLSFEDEDALRALIAGRAADSLIMEEVVRNHDEIRAINPGSLNTVRVYAIRPKGGEPVILVICLRCGCGATLVDNCGAGGVGYPIDCQTGVICAPGVAEDGSRHICHPGTNKIVVGMKMPCFEEVKNMAIECMKVNRKVVSAGLDIAVTPQGVELIEVNFPGGRFALQMFDQVGKYAQMLSAV